MTYRRTLWLTVLMAAIALSLLLVAPAHAHGGAGDDLHGPAALWLVVLIYLQLLLIPVVGVWLTREVVAAWRPHRHLPEGL